MKLRHEIKIGISIDNAKDIVERLPRRLELRHKTDKMTVTVVQEKRLSVEMRHLIGVRPLFVVVDHHRSADQKTEGIELLLTVVLTARLHCSETTVEMLVSKDVSLLQCQPAVIETNVPQSETSVHQSATPTVVAVGLYHRHQDSNAQHRDDERYQARLCRTKVSRKVALAQQKTQGSTDQQLSGVEA